MASYTIETRERADGTVRYRCTVRLGGGKKITHRESRSFMKKKLAAQWGKKRASELEEKGVSQSFYQKEPVPSIGDLIRLYEDDDSLGGKSGRTKRYVLKMLADSDIARVAANKLMEKHLVQHCKDRREAGASPATINHDVAYLRSVLKVASPVFDIPVDDKAIVKALPTLQRLNLTGKSQRRSRRPTHEEISLLLEGLKERESHRGNKIPFCDILNFSIFTCMRIGEVCRIRWEDLNHQKRTVLVRDRKDPRKKAGNHMYVPLLGSSWEILQKQPRQSSRIFPFNEKSVTAGFQRVRNKIGIEDLRYHDLRREGASRLFEMGFTVEEVAQVTGHRDINLLWKVYTELNPADLHKKYNAFRA